MKSLIMISALALGSISYSFASDSEEKLRPWPRLTIYPTSVDVNINNFDDFDYTCSGNVYMYYQSGRQEVQYYYNKIYARTSDYRSFRNYNYNDRIVSANHTINCY